MKISDSPSTEPDLTTAPLDVLCARARAQEASFVHGETSDGAAGFELFRRAIADSDEDAWAAVMTVYRGLLIAQAQRQLLPKLVDVDDGFCADRAFQRFWRATRTGQTQGFDDLASILKYLRMCLTSVLLDEARLRRRQSLVSIDDRPHDAPVGDDPSTAVVGQIAGRELWQAVEQELRDESERLVAQLSFVAGLSPREIRARHPDIFSGVDEVYRLKRNIIDRLRRSRTGLMAPSHAERVSEEPAVLGVGGIAPPVAQQRFRVGSHGRLLFHRERGRQVREEIERSLEYVPGPYDLVLDFEGVEAIDFAFLSELLRISCGGSLASATGVIVIYAGLDPYLLEAVDVAARNAGPFVGRDTHGNQILLGQAGPELQRIFALLSEGTPLTVRDLCERVPGVAPSAMNNRLADLLQAGAVRRWAIDGRTFAYVAPVRSRTQRARPGVPDESAAAVLAGRKVAT